VSVESPTAASAEACPWDGLIEAARRLTVSQVRARCATLSPRAPTFRAKMESARPAALLAPITELNGEAAVVVTKRPPTMLHHRDDWVFPSGRLDPARDASTREAAVREAAEELGAPPGRIELIGQLATQGPIMTGFLIDVFIGFVPLEDIAPHPHEVADWAVLPISALTAPGAYWRSVHMPDHQAGPPAAGWEGWDGDARRAGMRFFGVREGEVLWGTQGEVLDELLCGLFGAD